MGDESYVFFGHSAVFQNGHRGSQNILDFVVIMSFMIVEM